MIKIKKEIGKKIYLIIAIFVFILVSINLFLSSQEIKIITDKEEYQKEESLRVKIINNFIGKNVCFSSCYPYYLEEKVDKKWLRFEYSNCDSEDLNENCVDSKGVKAFEIVLPNLESGIYRIASAICVNCDSGSQFTGKRWVYSEAFIVK
ncbi:MAG: hypothetical protein COU98_00625 [Candidatus Staskawiczbacteria bacterium CG10_big_fil_rev_8_21_14_0_10_38_10]|uniref:Uncharacterized protein n=1 Tax=Candidatus Staskawiczbacteria bacterium CG10_big_fil_rev_8_21_14_0_10_38_10 TaxID=1974891 RepID=A0A2H9T1X1_9BACT|nr:MAG: hypothetical protein COU98_00625 [Candidatus Staskawiczbacteria bacterium CG10_big_fil_rev_8_21_14_0_10_38_10]